MTHPLYTLLMASLVSGATALLGQRTARERVYYGVYTFLSCTVAVVAGGWLMYLVHR